MCRRFFHRSAGNDEGKRRAWREPFHLGRISPVANPSSAARSCRSRLGSNRHTQFQRLPGARVLRANTGWSSSVMRTCRRNREAVASIKGTKYHRVMPTGTFDLKAWARVGAERRLEEIRGEIRRIHAAFPDLAVADAGRMVLGPKSRTPSTNGKRRKRVMSVETRARMAAAQRRRWAKHRKTKRA